MGKTVVVTGGSKGIGYGLAKAFLERGCNVAICSRNATSVNDAIAKLGAAYGAEKVMGIACDMHDPAAVQQLWDTTLAKFGSIDIWVNNAGQSNRQLAFWKLDDEQVDNVVNANVLGAMHGSKAAINGMLQQGHGALYNMLGFGSSGVKLNGMALYGTTKYAMKYFTDALKKEVKDTPVIVGSLSPGMIPTELLLGDEQAQTERTAEMKRIFNILADHLDTVAPWLVDEMLGNRTNGKDIAWLTKWKIAWRFLTSPFHKRHIIP